MRRLIRSAVLTGLLVLGLASVAAGVLTIFSDTLFTGEVSVAPVVATIGGFALVLIYFFIYFKTPAVHNNKSEVKAKAEKWPYMG